MLNCYPLVKNFADLHSSGLQQPPAAEIVCLCQSGHHEHTSHNTHCLSPRDAGARPSTKEAFKITVDRTFGAMLVTVCPRRDPEGPRQRRQGHRERSKLLMVVWLALQYKDTEKNKLQWVSRGLITILHESPHHDLMASTCRGGRCSLAWERGHYQKAIRNLSSSPGQ